MIHTAARNKVKRQRLGKYEESLLHAAGVLINGGCVELGLVFLRVEASCTRNFLVEVHLAEALVPFGTHAVRDAHENRMVKVFGVTVASQDFGDDVRAILTGESDVGKAGRFTSFVHAFDGDSVRKDAFAIDLGGDFAAVLVLDHKVKVSYVGCVKDAEKLQGVRKVDFGGFLAAMTGGTDVKIFELHNYYSFFYSLRRMFA